jgi:hypothetical protein
VECINLISYLRGSNVSCINLIANLTTASFVNEIQTISFLRGSVWQFENSVMAEVTLSSHMSRSATLRLINESPHLTPLSGSSSLTASFSEYSEMAFNQLIFLREDAICSQ